MLFRKTGMMIAALVVFAICTLTVSVAEAANLRIINRSGSDIHAIYISSSGSRDWEENIIEGEYLPSGNEFTIDVRANYRFFDLRVEDRSGNSVDYFEFPGRTRVITIRRGGQSEYE